jgi:cytoskeletal protein CcmA (bactofilin family)
MGTEITKKIITYFLTKNKYLSKINKESIKLNNNFKSMFKKDEKFENFNEAETIIGESVFVKGNFESNGNIIINGSLEGDIKTKGAVLVGEKSKISANISAEEMIVKGRIDGNLVISNYLSIGSSATIIGNIECSQISIEKGAEIKGDLLVSGQANKNKKESFIKEEETIEEIA